MTRMTMAALAIVDAIDGKSAHVVSLPSYQMKRSHLHILTILPSTLSPKDRYPVMPTRT